MSTTADPVRRARPGTDPARRGVAPPVARRQPKPAARTASTTDARRRAATVRTARPAPSRGLPSWAELAGAAPAGAVRVRRTRLLDAVPSLRFGAWTLVACVAVTLYVGHTYATQELVADVQALRRENLRLHLKRERLQGAFDEATGPDRILGRAAALGLEEGVAYGPVIRLAPVED